MPEFPLGKRLSIDGALCTIRYYGPLADQQSNWLGVEWDELHRGKHNGSHQGQQIFQPLSPWPKSSSFIRPTRSFDTSKTFLGALRFKYAEAGVDGEATAEADRGTQVTEISGKVVEEVGFEKIRRQQAELQDLKIVVLDGMRIRSDPSESGEQIAATCPNIVELDLSRNLFERWSDIADICAPLTRLKRLKASGSRLKDLENERSGPFDLVEELHINDCLLAPQQILAILCRHRNGKLIGSQFPKLSSLFIAGNQLSTFDISEAQYADLEFPSIHKIDLEGNDFTSLLPLCLSLTSHFPNTHTMSLQRNHISSLLPQASPSSHSLTKTSFPGITSLDLSRNAISSSTFTSLLSTTFPILSTLRITNNPIFNLDPSDFFITPETAFMLTLARIPSLTILNYSPISARERADAEFYYLSVAEKAFSAAAQRGEDPREVKKECWGRYEELCVKYDRPNALLAAAEGDISSADARPSGSMYPPGSLGSRLVTIHFELHSLSSSIGLEQKDAKLLSLRIPRSFHVYRVKGILLRKAPREWGLRALGFEFEIFGMGDEKIQEEGETIPNSTRRIGDWMQEEWRECWIRVTVKVAREKKKGVGIGIGEAGMRKLKEIGMIEAGVR